MTETEKRKERITSSSLPLSPPNSGETTAIPVSHFPDLSFFSRSTTYPALIVPVKRTAELRNSLSDVLLHRPKIKNVYTNLDDVANTTRKLVLQGDEALEDPRVKALLSGDKKSCSEGISNAVVTKSHHTITLTYADCTVDEILRQVLPPSITELPGAFEIVGSIAHLNLRDDLLPYKYIVGKVILDKNVPRIQTVVNKLGTIANEYRTFGMEVIAGYDGPDWSLVKVKEEGCEFTLDFQHVYWNSRLGAVHKRLVALIEHDAQQRAQSTIVADLMAGVGPFAVPLTACLPHKGNKDKKKKNKQPQTSNSTSDFAKAKIIVHANDLNPCSYKYLKVNAEKNKCATEKLKCYNMDARAFCHLLQDGTIGNCTKDNTDDLSSPTLSASVDFHHAIMNLPASAPEFLDAFRGFTNPTLPRIHVYCFAPKPPSTLDDSTITEDIDTGVRQRCSTALGCPLDSKLHNVVIRIVRDVSPKKNMVCVSFDLPEAVRTLPRIAVEARIGGASRTDNDIGNSGKDSRKRESADEPDESLLDSKRPKKLE